MLSGVMAKALVVAAIAAGGVWLYTSATFSPFVEDRPFCSGAGLLPNGPSGVGLPANTFPPHCRFGPIPADRLAPSPVPALGAFILVVLAGLVIGAYRPVSSPRR